MHFSLSILCLCKRKIHFFTSFILTDSLKIKFFQSASRGSSCHGPGRKRSGSNTKIFIHILKIALNIKKAVLKTLKSRSKYHSISKTIWNMFKSTEIFWNSQKLLGIFKTSQTPLESLHISAFYFEYAYISQLLEISWNYV